MNALALSLALVAAGPQTDLRGLQLVNSGRVLGNISISVLP
jgi:hypothetical protein